MIHAVSIPRAVGCLLRPVAGARVARGNDGFNPSFGRLPIATIWWANSGTVNQMFQSLVRAFANCDGACRGPDYPPRAVSIPRSGVCQLRRGGGGRARSVIVGFNPSFGRLPIAT